MSKIYLKGVSKQYPDFCIKDVNLSFGNKGKVACLFGQSGSGKSTLLNLISGLVKPSSGAIIVNNRIFFDKVLDIDLGPEKRDIALIFQQPSLFPNKTIMENVKFAVKNGKDAECIADLMLKQVGMHGYKDKTPQFISGGQQQLVTLARAFAQEPSVILLDEPFSSLDAILRPNTREKVISLIKKRNLISVFVTHDPLEALEIADEIIVMEKGKIIMHDSPLNVYYRPKNLKIANLFGHVNHVPGRVEGDKFVSLWGKFNLPNNFCQKMKISSAVKKNSHF